MTPHEEMARGARAKALLEDEMFREAIDKVQAGIIASWKSSPVRDIDGQHELKLMLKLLSDLEGNIRQVMETGKLASIQIERESKFSKFMRDML